MLRVLFIFNFILIGGQITAQTEKNYIPFKSSDYPENKYSVILDIDSFLNYKIQILQLHLEDHDLSEPSDFYCRGWLTVKKGEQIISKSYFPTIEAVGNCYGFFIPYNQPRKDCFIVSKIDGYEASIYIVDNTGAINEIWGGSFYVSKDNRFLFSNEASDLPDLTVYDLENKILLYSDSSVYHLNEWYYANEKYYATIWNYETDQIDENQIALFDTKNRILSFISKDGFTFDNRCKLDYYNSINPENRCNCGR